MTEPTLALWSDDPARVDLLSFDAVVKTVADALFDEALDPVALSLSGSWGSGKTTVFGLVAQELDRHGTPDSKVNRYGFVAAIRWAEPPSQVTQKL